MSEQATMFFLPEPLRSQGWRGEKLAVEPGNYRIRVVHALKNWRFETVGPNEWSALADAVAIATAVERYITTVSSGTGATCDECGEPLTDLDDAIECECTCEAVIDIEGLGSKIGKEVAAYLATLVAGGFTQDEAQYLAGDLHDRLWDIALGDA